jgi:hypothetical protein
MKKEASDVVAPEKCKKPTSGTTAGTKPTKPTT